MVWRKRSCGGGRRARLWNARRQADQSSPPAADWPPRHRPALRARTFTLIDGHPRADADQTGGPAVSRHRGNWGGRAGAKARESVVGRGGGAPPATRQSVAGSVCGSGSDGGVCRRRRRVPPSARGQKDAGGAKMDGRWGEASTASLVSRPAVLPSASREHPTCDRYGSQPLWQKDGRHGRSWKQGRNSWALARRAPPRHSATSPTCRWSAPIFSFPVTPFFLGGDPPSPRTRQETEPWQPAPAHSEPLPSRQPHNPCPRPPNTRRYRAKLPHRSGRLWRQRYGWAVPEGANGGWGCGSSAGWGSRGLGWVPAAAPHVPVSPEADARTRRGTTTAPARRLGGGGTCRGAQARRVSGTTRSGWQRRPARSILDRCPAKGLRPDLHSRSTT